MQPQRSCHVHYKESLAKCCFRGTRSACTAEVTYLLIGPLISNVWVCIVSPMTSWG